jgi:hypothetical protein
LANASDRGGAGSQANLYQEWLEQRRGDEIAIGDVTQLSRARIDELGAIHGAARVALAVQRAALTQLPNVRIVPDADRSTYERLAEIDAAPELSASDKAAAKSDVLRRYGYYQHAHQELRRQALVALAETIASVVGDERVNEIIGKLGEDGVNKVLATPKHKRRAALARALEEL